MPPTLSKAEIEAALRDMRKATARLEAIAARSSNRLVRAYAEAEAGIYRRILELSADLPANLRNVPLQTKLSWYISNSATIRNSSELAGVSDALGAYVGDYRAMARFAEQMLSAGMTPPEFTRINQRLIETLMKQDYSYFEGLKQAAVDRLDKALFDAVIGGATKKTMLAEIKSTITGSYPWGKRRGLYEWHAGTYVRTANMRAGRAMVATQAKEAGITNYVYIGPVDSKVRPFCQDFIGTVQSETDIDGLDNGQTGNVLIDGGGYNCRHQWNPISDELAASIKSEMESEEMARLVA